ncbi:DUF4221 family protein [Algoriphagus algorifonticola]|uniref:DUF4221 family protein n=1 Tax=Algoriphagus algorifonticola TaxID=2593007 RepID=UPI00164349D9|nr:DUF4221 family protein [Algoriphagus algorifonticola]
MKNLPIYFLILFLISCGGDPENSSSNQNLEISYEIDTVMVDAGDHFFFVRYSLSMSDVDKDQKLLYNFNNQEMVMEIIDLENLKLKEVRQYEKEGPNGIGGGFIMRIQVLPDESVLFYDFVGIHHVAKSGEKISTHKLGEIEWQGDELAEEEEINVSSLDTRDGKLFYGFYGTQGFDSKILGLVKIDLSDQSLRLFPSDFLQFTSDFEISFEMNGGGMAKAPEQNRVRVLDDKILITSSAKNQIWQWILEQDSLISRSYESQLSSNSKKGNFPMQASSPEEFRAAMKEKNKEVSFGRLIHDPEQNKFWRVHRDLERITAGDTIIYKHILTAFDSEINQVGETLLPEGVLFFEPGFYLEGRLWKFLNIDDEVAFVRVKPEIK